MQSGVVFQLIAAHYKILHALLFARINSLHLLQYYYTLIRIETAVCFFSDLRAH